MKKILTFTFILLISFSTKIFSDETEFQIEGMSLDDSLLDYYSEKEIKKARIKSWSYKDKTYTPTSFSKKLKTYNELSVNFKTQDDNFTIEIKTMPSWLEVSPQIGTVVPGDIDEIFLLFSSGGLDSGEYDYTLQIKTNDYQNSTVDIPIYLSVLTDQCEGWETGDLNNDMALNINDVVILVNLVLGEDAQYNCQISSGDINSDDDLNVLDILLLVNLILD